VCRVLAILSTSFAVEPSDPVFRTIFIITLLLCALPKTIVGKRFAAQDILQKETTKSY